MKTTAGVGADYPHHAVAPPQPLSSSIPMLAMSGVHKQDAANQNSSDFNHNVVTAEESSHQQHQPFPTTAGSTHSNHESNSISSSSSSNIGISNTNRSTSSMRDSSWAMLASSRPNTSPITPNLADDSGEKENDRQSLPTAAGTTVTATTAVERDGGSDFKNSMSSDSLVFIAQVRLE